MRFEGLEPWALHAGVIEVVVDGLMYDLHNFGEVLAVQLLAPDSLALVVAYDPGRYGSPTGPPHGDGPATVTVTFAAVRELRLHQVEDFEPRAADSLDGIVWSHDRDGRDAIQLLAAELEALFVCDAVSVRVEPRA